MCTIENSLLVAMFVPFWVNFLGPKEENDRKQGVKGVHEGELG